MIDAGNELRLQLNPFFRVRFVDGVTLDLFLEGTTFTFHDARLIRLLARLDQPMPRSAVVAFTTWALGAGSEDAGTVVDELVDHKVLVAEDASYPMLPAVTHWVERGWLEALMLHMRSRSLDFADTAQDGARLAAEELRRIIEAEGPPPSFWKDYPGHRATALPPPDGPPGERSLEQILLARRSNRPWRKGRVDTQVLSSILAAANQESVRLRVHAEATWSTNPLMLLNSAFSALETYVFVFHVDGVDAGLYHYDLRDHKLVLLREGSLQQELVTMCIGQDRPAGAAFAVAISAVWGRAMFRYRHPRAYRTLLVNVAELAQKYIVLATAWGLSTFLTPALKDEFADALFGFDGYEEAALYVVAAG
jgi:SagB-type dehydrogenase family enzyme